MADSNSFRLIRLLETVLNVSNLLLIVSLTLAVCGLFSPMASYNHIVLSARETTANLNALCSESESTLSVPSRLHTGIHQLLLGASIHSSLPPSRLHEGVSVQREPNR